MRFQTIPSLRHTFITMLSCLLAVAYSSCLQGGTGKTNPKAPFFPPAKTEKESHLHEDLDRVGIRHESWLTNTCQTTPAVSTHDLLRPLSAVDVAAHALIQACSPTIDLHDSMATMQHILTEQPQAVNFAGPRQTTPLCTVVHGIFNAPIEQVKLLIDAKADTHNNNDAICNLSRTTKFLTTPDAKKNAAAVFYLLVNSSFKMCKHPRCIKNREQLTEEKECLV